MLLSCIAADARPGAGLVSDLRSAALHVAQVVSADDLRVENPACREDVLSDRWPKRAGSNRRFAADLGVLIDRLDELVRADGTQVRKRDILMDLFGENAARDGYRLAVERAGMQSRSGQFAAAGTGVVSFSGIVPKGSTAAPKHKFYGGAAR